MSALLREAQEALRTQRGEEPPHIVLGAGALEDAVRWTAARNCPVLMVSDPCTRKAAGAALYDKLLAAGVHVREYRYAAPPLPDEQAVGELLCASAPEDGLLLAVGSGTLGDIVKYVGWKLGKPCAVVGTAPSMDGYASAGAAMLLGGIKVTPRTGLPAAIFCDTDILQNAPLPMIATGLGDLLGKYTALADWKLAALLGGEIYDESVACWVEEALLRCESSAEGAVRREAKAIESLCEGLLLSGLAMSVHGDSRPASGTEHHLAHFWEMRAHFTGREPAPHGALVGVGTVLALRMWALLAETGLSALAAPLPEPERTARIREQYGAATEGLLTTSNPLYPPERLAACRDEILAIARSLPAPERVAELLRLAGGCVTPPDAGIDPLTLRDSVLWARERKKTCTLLQLLGNLGRLEDFAARLKPDTGFLRDIRCFVLDLDGTVYLGGKLFPTSLPFLEKLRQKGVDVLFFTNNSSESCEHYVEKLRALGIPLRPEQMQSSTRVLLDYLSRHEPRRRVYIAGTPALREEMQAAGYIHDEHCPDFAVLGFDRTMRYETLARLCDFARAGLPVYGVNMDYNCPVEGGFIPDCGSLAAALTAATGVSPPFFGKPSRHTLEFVLRHTSLDEKELCFVGDRFYTDIAVTAGSRARSVMVLSGESRLEDLQGAVTQPDLVVDGLGELAELL